MSMGMASEMPSVPFTFKVLMPGWVEMYGVWSLVYGVICMVYGELIVNGV